MKNRIIALAAGMTLLLLSSLSAQAPDTLWTKTYGGTQYDYGDDVKQTFDGGYIIAGWTSSFGAGRSDVYLIRTDSLGDTLWTKTIGGPEREYGRSILIAPDSGFIIAGMVDSLGNDNFDFYLIKTDKDGNTTWTRKYGGNGYERGNSVWQTNDGGYILTGSTMSYGAGSRDVYLVKTDSLGDTLWTRTFGGSGWDEGTCVVQSYDGGYIATGWTGSYGAGDRDYYITKANATGDSIWAVTVGGSDSEESYSIQKTADSCYIIVGHTRSFGAGGADVYLVKINEDGDTLWTRTIGDNKNDAAKSISAVLDGGYIIAGETDLYNQIDVLVIKVDSIGNALWTKIIGGDNWDESYSVQQTTDDGYIITGFSVSYGPGPFAVYLIKLASDAGIVEEEISTYSPTDAKIVYYPNPFWGDISMKSLDGTDNRSIKLEIFSATGRLVKSVKLEASTYELGADLAPGIYFLKLNGTSVGKVVKVR